MATGLWPCAAAAPGLANQHESLLLHLLRQKCQNHSGCGVRDQSLALWAKRQRSTLGRTTKAIRHRKPPRSQRVSSVVMEFIGQAHLGSALNLFNRGSLGQGNPRPNEGKNNFCFFHVDPRAMTASNTHGGQQQDEAVRLGWSSL